jgi:hypothetical protein
MSLTIPPADIHGAFLARFDREVARLSSALADQRARVLVAPMENRRSGGAVAWYNPAAWPPGLPLPLTIGEALDRVRADAAPLAEELGREVERLAQEFVAPAMVPAVLDRCVSGWPDTEAAEPPAPPVHRWPLPASGPPPVAWPPGRSRMGLLLRLLTLAADGADEIRDTWPPEAAPLDVARWAREGLNLAGQRHGYSDGHDLGERAIERLGEGFPWLDLEIHSREVGGMIRFPPAGLALLYLAERDVRAGLRRPAVAVDAGRRHHDLLSGWRDLPRDGRRHQGAALERTPLSDGRIELLSGGRMVPVQLSLPLADLLPHEGTIAALRELRGAKGLRHWTALQRLWSIEGGRQGWVRWRLDEHMEAMGYGADARKREAFRIEVAREVEALTRLELAVYDGTGTQRHRAPLVHVGDRFEQLSPDGPWRLEGMELRPNDLLYRGVRDPASGGLGREFVPVPAELAKIDHVRHPYAHALGLLFAIRLRLTLAEQENRRDHVALSGANLLALAGIPSTLRADRAWERIRREVAELQRIDLLGRVEWASGDWTAAGVVRLYPAPWILDRTARGLIPTERPPVDVPMTGAELATWRKARGWSQREAARVLGVGQASVSRAEAAGAEALGPALAAALKRSTDRG